MLKRVLTITLAALAVGAVIVLSGCAPVAADYESEFATGKGRITHYGDYEVVILPNGLQCAVYDGFKEAGMSCNWEKFNKEQRR